MLYFNDFCNEGFLENLGNKSKRGEIEAVNQQYKKYIVELKHPQSKKYVKIALKLYNDLNEKLYNNK